MLRAIAVAAGVLTAGTSAAGAERLRPKDIHALPVSAPSLVQSYGSDPLQFGELRLPPGKGPFPVAVVIHGGCWTKGFDTLKGTAPIASALAAKGIATWNIEYRQVGDPGGGWPGSFQDWGAATDHLRVLAKSHPLDFKRVTTVGHSAGAHAALWIAARPRLPGGSEIKGRKPPGHCGSGLDGPATFTPSRAPTSASAASAMSRASSAASVADRPERLQTGQPGGALTAGGRGSTSSPPAC